MQTQNYSNHRRYVPLYHYIASGLIGAAFALSSFKLYKAITHKQFYFNAMVLLIISTALILIWFYSRAFALKAQNRAIRAEENFRHYLLTGKALDKKLNMRQIVALRFADDEEFPALAKKASDEHLKADEIKKAIKNWKEDSNRV
ncbi:MAG: DUF6526 family protein [Bacteroidota bacterium]